MPYALTLTRVAVGTYSEHYLPTGKRDQQVCRACLHGCQESFDATEHEDEDADPDLVAMLQKMATHPVMLMSGVLAMHFVHDKSQKQAPVCTVFVLQKAWLRQGLSCLYGNTKIPKAQSRSSLIA
eukprot:COSAG02_NODE_1495_length_12314_cov_33.691691_11_plen_125_part_00